MKKKDGGFLDRAFINFFIFVVVEKIYDTVCCVLQLQYIRLQDERNLLMRNKED